MNPTTTETPNPFPRPSATSVARASRWASLPLSDWFQVDADHGLDRLPLFDRVAPEKLGLGANPSFDMVVRRRGPGSPSPVPVAMVSKNYRIVQHREVFDRVLGFAANIPDATPANAEMRSTLHGERVMLRIDLGDMWKFGPDGKSVGLQVLCRNSVDGSSALRLHLGWFRLICSNGLVVGVTLGRSRMAHTESADLNRAFEPIERQLEIVKAERENLKQWATKPVSLDAVRAWSDSVVATKWNTLSAARVWHICQSGRDVKFTPPFEKVPSSRRKVKLLDPVPGAPAVAETIYDVAQGLSWVASRRNDVDEAEAQQRDIGPLLEELQRG